MEIPTNKQLVEFFRIVYLLTNMYLSVNLARVDERQERLIILAGDEIEIIITKEGRVVYDEAELQGDE